MATVCDVMPLRYINRLIAIKTLDEFNLNKTMAIKKIYEILDKTNKISINDLGYLIGPILNAGGRLGYSNYAVKLLSSSDDKEIEFITKKLIELNQKRKSFEEIVLNNIDYKKIENENENVIIYYDPTINEGLIGIIAARLKDIFNKPTIVLTKSQDLLKGSARSIFGFDIGVVFKNALDIKLIIKGGGHKMAAGFSMNENNLINFKKFINNSYKSMCKNLKKNSFFYESKISSSTFSSSFDVMKLINFILLVQVIQNLFFFLKDLK